MCSGEMSECKHNFVCLQKTTQATFKKDLFFIKQPDLRVQLHVAHTGAFLTQEYCLPPESTVSHQQLNNERVGSH